LLIGAGVANGQHPGLTFVRDGAGRLTFPVIL